MVITRYKPETSLSLSEKLMFVFFSLLANTIPYVAEYLWQIGKDVAAQYVEGWDWICPIR